MRVVVALVLMGCGTTVEAPQTTTLALGLTAENIPADTARISVDVVRAGASAGKVSVGAPWPEVLHVDVEPGDGVEVKVVGETAEGVALWMGRAAVGAVPEGAAARVEVVIDPAGTLFVQGLAPLGDGLLGLAAVADDGRAADVPARFELVRQDDDTWQTNAVEGRYLLAFDPPVPEPPGVGFAVEVVRGEKALWTPQATNGSEGRFAGLPAQVLEPPESIQVLGSTPARVVGTATGAHQHDARGWTRLEVRQSVELVTGAGDWAYFAGDGVTVLDRAGVVVSVNPDVEATALAANPADGAHALVGTRNGELLLTRDGGERWAQVRAPDGAHVAAILMLDDGGVVVATGVNDVLLESDDGGETFATVPVQLDGWPSGLMAFAGSLRIAVAVGDGLARIVECALPCRGVTTLEDVAGGPSVRASTNGGLLGSTFTLGPVGWALTAGPALLVSSFATGRVDSHGDGPEVDLRGTAWTVDHLYIADRERLLWVPVDELW